VAAIDVRNDYLGEDPAFTVEVWVDHADRAVGIENITVWIEQGNAYAEVTDDAGNVVECGHQRPPEINEKWSAQAARCRIENAEKQDKGAEP
jgi:hypothetical protein